MPRSPRFACAAVPLFPLAARLRSEPDLRAESVAVFEGNGTSAHVVAATRAARQAGIQPGMTLPQARALVPRLLARGRDRQSEQAAQDALLDVAETFSPRIEETDQGVVTLDIDGLERRFGGEFAERDLGQALSAAVGRAGLPARVGIASSKLAARVASALPGSPTVVAPGEEARFLAPLPLEKLSPELDVSSTLSRWGIRSIGELAQLSAAEVSARLGELGRRLHALARGADPLPLMPRAIPPTFREGMELEWPLVTLEPFLSLSLGALERLMRRLEAQALGCVRLELALTLEPDGYDLRDIALPAPTRDVKTLLKLIQLNLEARLPGAAVAAFAFTAHPDRPRSGQLTLFGPTEISPDKLATALARLMALLGDDRLGQPQTVDGHRPERFAITPYAPPPAPATRRKAPDGRGLLSVRVLRPPVELEVLTEEGAKEIPKVTTSETPSPEGIAKTEATRHARHDLDVPPSHAAIGTERDERCPSLRLVSVRSLTPHEESAPAAPSPEGERPAGSRPRAVRPPEPLQIEGPVRVASGPWQLEEAWWSDAPVSREYWDVELVGGGIYRLFRERGSGGWFADGIYD